MDKVTTIPYPFVRCKASIFDGEGYAEIDSWRPGTEYGPPDPYSDVERQADGIGSMTITEVGRYKPGRFPERVFYTRTFTTPDGVAFGKGGLHVAVASKFSRITTRYGHPYKVIDTPPGGQQT